MKEVKIQIPDNCELIKDGDTYVVKKKKQVPPRSWEEFCANYLVKKGETYIDTNGKIHIVDIDLNIRKHRNWCTSEKEAEAFLALMQLRQLRKAWIGDLEEQNSIKNYNYNIVNTIDGLDINNSNYDRPPLSFPTKEMAEDFFNCFRDLCETAKELL